MMPIAAVGSGFGLAVARFFARLRRRRWRRFEGLKLIALLRHAS